MKGKRPTFCYKNNKDQLIRAGGLILYRYDDLGEAEFLLIRAFGRYEDFGGRTDAIDTSIEDTICREADEESNGILGKNEMLDLIKNEEPVYCNKSKYMIYIAKAKKMYDPKEFGDLEIHDNIPRTVEWIKLSKMLDKNFIDQHMHIRLKFMFFFKRIRSLGKNNNGNNGN